MEYRKYTKMSDEMKNIPVHSSYTSWLTWSQIVRRLCSKSMASSCSSFKFNVYNPSSHANRICWSRVTGWTHEAVPWMCSGHSLKILEKHAPMCTSGVRGSPLATRVPPLSFCSVCFFRRCFVRGGGSGCGAAAAAAASPSIHWARWFSASGSEWRNRLIRSVALNSSSSSSRSSMLGCWDMEGRTGVERGRSPRSSERRRVLSRVSLLLECRPLSLLPSRVGRWTDSGLLWPGRWLRNLGEKSAMNQLKRSWNFNKTQSINQNIDRPLKIQSINQSTHQSIGWMIKNHSINQLSEWANKKIINLWFEQSINQSIDQSNNRCIDQSIDRTDQSTDEKF